MIASLSTGTSAAFDIWLVMSALGFGFRHGIDWDHIAALTDITGSQVSPRRSMRFATLYAVGHGLVVFSLGVVAVMFAAELPASVDTTMERLVGVTLVVLALYVGYALVRHGREFRMRSRWMLLLAGVRRGARRLRAHRVVPQLVEIEHDHPHAPAHDHHGAHFEAHAIIGGREHEVVEPSRTHRHLHRHVVPIPVDPFIDYGSKSAFGVGMIHGIGAETPTQVLIFLAAAGAGGRAAGLLLLGCFIVGLLASNTLISLAGAFGFLGASANFKLYAAVSVTTAVCSLVIGSLFLVGQGSMLPAVFGG